MVIDVGIYTHEVQDQKVMWHATPFEERLAQALATQQDSVPQRYPKKINSSMAAQPAHEVVLVLLVLYHDFYLF